jgi:hypothetical protein
MYEMTTQPSGLAFGVADAGPGFETHYRDGSYVTPRDKLEFQPFFETAYETCKGLTSGTSRGISKLNHFRTRRAFCCEASSRGTERRQCSYG